MAKLECRYGSKARSVGRDVSDGARRWVNQRPGLWNPLKDTQGDVLLSLPDMCSDNQTSICTVGGGVVGKNSLD